MLSAFAAPNRTVIPPAGCRMIATVVQPVYRPFVPTSLSLPSEYDHASHPERITVGRRDLERCLRITIEETMCCGGRITTLARKCMDELDTLACDAEAAKCTEL